MARANEAFRFQLLFFSFRRHFTPDELRRSIWPQQFENEFVSDSGRKLLIAQRMPQTAPKAGDSRRQYYDTNQPRQPA
jgi:hypothetical protein